MKISKKISWIVFTCALSALLPSLYFFYLITKKELLQGELDHIRHQIDLVMNSFIADIEIGNRDLEELAELIKRRYPKNDPMLIESFDEKMMLFDDGIWRNDPNNYNGIIEPGLYLPSELPITDARKQFFGLLLKTLESYGAASNSQRTFVNIWFLGHKREEVIFDLVYPDFIYLMDASTDYTETDWMTLASPSRNPNRETRWTPTLFDPVSETWMVSAVHPLDINDEWVGTLGHDMQLQLLFSLIDSISDKFSGEQHILRDHLGGFILAGPWQKQLEEQLDKFVLPATEVSLAQALTAEFDEHAKILEEITIQGTKYQTIAIELPAMDWTYLNLIPTEEITAPLQPLVLRAALIFIITVIAISLLIQSSTHYIITKPIRSLVDRTRVLASGHKPSEPTSWGSDELGALGVALDNMHDDLEKESRQVVESESRYRNVVNNIRETLVRIDTQGRWQFLSPTWFELTGRDIQRSLNQPFTDSFDIKYLQLLGENFQQLLSGEKEQWVEEVRLVNEKHHAIWVRLSLRVSHELNETFIVGTIENIHLTYLAELSRKTLRMTEQMVLTSDSSVFLLLDYVTKMMANTLDVPLFWIRIKHLTQRDRFFKSGELADSLVGDYLFWDDLFGENGPATYTSKSEDMVRMTSRDNQSNAWHKHIQLKNLHDNLFVSFHLNQEYQGVIGMHSQLEDIFDEGFQQLISNFASGLRVVCQLSLEQQLMRIHRSAVEKSTNAIMITDERQSIEWVNHSFEVLTQFTLAEILGQSSNILSTPENSISQITDISNTTSSGKTWRGEIFQRCKNGSSIIVDLSVFPLMNKQNIVTHYISISQDITEAKASQARIQFLATHDELTDLPNRSLLNDYLESAIEKTNKHNLKFAVLFIDLDQFKVINDSYGHKLGDSLLKEVAQRISAELSEQDMFARFGGDEFVVVLSEIKNQKSVALTAEKILFVINQPYFINNLEINTSASVGIAMCPDDSTSAEVLIQSADSAMYHSKTLGRNAFCFYTKELHNKVLRKHLLEKALLRALKGDQFVLHYQPKIDLNTHQVFGAECLIRWQHPDMGIISPDEFIPLAEETGMIVDIGAWVLEAGCQKMKEWSEQYPWFKLLSINLSARQFQKETFFDDLRKLIHRLKLNASTIDLEITESIIMEDVESAISILSGFQNTGFSISIDDFGTGYSSLSYLKRLPADTLKIDKTFVSELGHETADEAIIRSILALAKNLNLSVVAEGIETAQQAEMLKNMGCQHAQGYYFSKPLPVDKMENLLQATNKNKGVIKGHL